jgi:transposase
MAYEDPGASYYEERYRDRVLKGLRRGAKEFGYELTEAGTAEGVS